VEPRRLGFCGRLFVPEAGLTGMIEAS